METTEKVKELESILERANAELKEKTAALDEARQEKDFWYEQYASLNWKFRGLAFALKGTLELSNEGEIVVNGI
ncbi:MAG: hypothetical protein LBV41_08800 [Cytophagaceae bacterium]|jgi:hypothetical protein|nr:hypothetical protein [Cytophagaceae bacterium]